MVQRLVALVCQSDTIYDLKVGGGNIYGPIWPFLAVSEGICLLLKTTTI